MDSRKLQVGWSFLGLALASLSSIPARADTTAWLVRPLYPGQEALVSRTEGALDKLMPGEARKGAVIGIKELAQALKGRRVDELPCFGPEVRCADPIDAFVANLGFERVVLIEGGQDEAGFKYKVTAFEPKTGRVTPASATAPSLEKALLGAVAKVVPAASTLDVKTTPPGASVYIDDIKVGVTPLSTQVLPGERVVRLDLKLHQPIEDSVIIPIRGAAAIERTLEKVAARIVITASPPGTEIFIDGQLLGKDKVDRGILPGTHTIRLQADLHKRFEQQITVKADEQYVLDKTLEPSSGFVGPERAYEGVTPVRVGPPPTPEELVYDRRSYFQLSGEYGRLTGNTLVGRRLGSAGTGRTELIANPPEGRSMLGFAAEYGTFGKYFGITVFGVSYLTNTDLWQMSVGYAKGADKKSDGSIDPNFQAPEVINGVVQPSTIEQVKVHLVTIRALQPQLRLALWRFMLALQVGFEFRTGQIVETGVIHYIDVEKGPFDGFIVTDLLLAGRLNVRYFIYDGLYMFGQGNYSQLLVGETTNNDIKSSSSWGVNVGVGYGF